MSAASTVLVPLRFIFLISNLLLIVEIFARNECHVDSSLPPLPEESEVLFLENINLSNLNSYVESVGELKAIRSIFSQSKVSISNTM